ncbi:retinal homeobox protein Rx [Caerostris extrusa]|uniref:Retinal homeobox protein Rx n=1 Tax=Caerostris extrusa TaxID=172846 RepID=A0AAV4TTQ3_CAEEX|nr:retinal homeobox protein Rx [Caerostris extrusa]
MQVWFQNRRAKWRKQTRAQLLLDVCRHYNLRAVPPRDSWLAAATHRFQLPQSAPLSAATSAAATSLYSAVPHVLYSSDSLAATQSTFSPMSITRPISKPKTRATPTSPASWASHLPPTPTASSPRPSPRPPRSLSWPPQGRLLPLHVGGRRGGGLHLSLSFAE